MSAAFLLVPILLPIAGGAGILLMKPGNDKKIRSAALAAILLTSSAAFAGIFLASRDIFTLYSFTQGFAINFRADGPAVLFAGMVSFMWPFVTLYAFSYMENEKTGGGAPHAKSFYAFFTMSFGMTLGLAFSADLVTMYVFFEMLTLSTLPLVSHYRDHESLYAGRLYAAFCIAGASLGFIAVVVGTADGSGEFAYGGNLGGVYAPWLLRLSYLFGFFGFGAKAAVFPLSKWLPEASVAPTPVTALLHAVAVVNSGVFAVMRLTYYAFGPDVLKGSAVQAVALSVSAFTIVYAAFRAVKERHFKRRLAYSTVSNLSYMLYGAALMTPTGLAACLCHMVMHGVIKMALFLCAGAFMHKTGRGYVYEIDGAGYAMPVTFACFTAGALSLTGIPLFSGFVSKWQLLTAGASEGSIFALIGVAALVIAAFCCAIYTLSVPIRAFFGKPDPAFSSVNEADWRMLVPIIVFTCVNVLLGIASGPLLSFLGKIAAGEL